MSKNKTKIKRKEKRTSAPDPLISIVIPTFNESQDINLCLWSIARQTIRDQVEVIIVDDDSVDNTLENVMAWRQELNIKIIRNGTHDAERGKRIGLTHATGQFFTYCDADMSYRDSNYLETAVKPLLEIVGISKIGRAHV